MTHELKTWPGPFKAVMAGVKTHEIRKNDREFKIGDVLLLKEYDPAGRGYTGSFCAREVTYISYGGTWGLPYDLCVMSIRHLSAPPSPSHKESQQ